MQSTKWFALIDEDKLLNAKLNFFPPCVHKVLANGILYARRTDFLTDFFF